jgi:hypothetical protein
MCTRCVVGTTFFGQMDAKYDEREDIETESNLLLKHLRTVIFWGIAQDLGFINRRLAASICVRGAVCRALSAAFDEDVSLFSQKSAFLVLLHNRVGKKWTSSD